LTCDYRKSTAQATPTTATTILTGSPAPTPQLELTTRSHDNTQNQPWDTGDLELLHHYTTCCCVHVPGEHRRQLWTREIVNIAFSQDYLLYQILAVSALHIFHQNRSREDLLAKAVSYRGLALQRINPVLAAMTADSCIPVFAFAGLSMVYAFAELVALHDREGGEQTFDPIRHITGCLQQNFGIRTVVHTYRAAIQESWASELININSDAEFDLLASSGLVFSHAEMCHSLIDKHERRPRWNSACHDALGVLLQTIQILMWRPEDHPSFSLINAWPSVLKPEFWELLEGNAPVALLVLAYFAALMSLRPKLWWFRCWPGLLFDGIEERLDEEWREALAWPKGVVEAFRVAT
jgi:hypothetical protein